MFSRGFKDIITKTAIFKEFPGLENKFQNSRGFKEIKDSWEPCDSPTSFLFVPSLYNALYIIYVCIYVCMYVRMYACTRVRVYACTHVRVYACTRVRVYACTHVRMYVCTNAYIHKHFWLEVFNSLIFSLTQNVCLAVSIL